MPPTIPRGPCACEGSPRSKDPALLCGLREVNSPLWAVPLPKEGMVTPLPPLSGCWEDRGKHVKLFCQLEMGVGYHDLSVPPLFSGTFYVRI